MDRQRIDKWLWHARVVRTRSAAAALAASGHVRVNGERIDAPSRAVRSDDVVTVALDRTVRVLRVRRFAERRYVGEVRGIGLIGAIELMQLPATRTAFDPAKKAGPRLAELALEEGLVVRSMTDAIAFCPPLIITAAQIDELFARFERAMDRFEATFA